MTGRRSRIVLALVMGIVLLALIATSILPPA